MQEKAMVSDALNTLNSGLKTYTDMISQTENQELRSALQQMRNEAEKSQYELYTIAKNKNYYQPSGQASQNEINSLKVTFSGSISGSGSIKMSGQTGNMGSNSTFQSDSGMIGSMSGGSSSSGNATMTGGTSSFGSESGITGGLGRSDIEGSLR